MILRLFDRYGPAGCDRAGDAAGAAWQRYFEQRATGQECIDAGGFQQGHWHLVAAELLKPKPAPWPEPAPPPRPVK